MDLNQLLVLERIDEVTMMCARDNPVYEQIGNFSIALYVLGYFEGPDLMSIYDLDVGEASAILRDDFEKIVKSDMPLGYNIAESKERYLLVVGDPDFPAHFAVVVDTTNKRPFFSKLRYMGSGFDTLDELMCEFLGEDGICYGDLHYFRKLNE